VLYATNHHIRKLVLSVYKHQERIFVVLTYVVIFFHSFFRIPIKTGGWHYRLGEHFIKLLVVMKFLGIPKGCLGGCLSSIRRIDVAGSLTSPSNKSYIP
jgi:hypothetical protein